MCDLPRVTQLLSSRQVSNPGGLILALTPLDNSKELHEWYYYAIVLKNMGSAAWSVGNCAILEVFRFLSAWVSLPIKYVQ